MPENVAASYENAQANPAEAKVREQEATRRQPDVVSNDTQPHSGVFPAPDHAWVCRA